MSSILLFAGNGNETLSRGMKTSSLVGSLGELSLGLGMLEDVFSDRPEYLRVWKSSEDFERGNVGGVGKWRGEGVGMLELVELVDGILLLIGFWGELLMARPGKLVVGVSEVDVLILLDSELVLTLDTDSLR